MLRISARLSRHGAKNDELKYTATKYAIFQYTTDATKIRRITTDIATHILVLTRVSNANCMVPIANCRSSIA